MKCIKTRFKVSSINYTARFASQYYTLLNSNQTVQHQHTSLTTSMSTNSTQQMTAYACFPKAPNSQRYTAATDWLTRSNQHTRGATTLNVTRPPPHNIAVTHKQLHTNTASLLETNSSNNHTKTPYSTPIYLLYPLYPLLYQSHNAPSYLYVVSRLRAKTKRFY